MTAEANVALIRRAVDAVNQDDMAVLAEILAPGAVRHDLAGAVPDAVGQPGVTDFLQMLRGALPDMRIRIEDIFGAGDRVAMRITAVGTHEGELLGAKPTGKHIEVAGVNVYRIEGGRIAETWQLTDWAGALRQIGAELPRGEEEAASV